MADNKRWFKVWNTILTDPSFEMLSNDFLGVWTRLGCLLSIQGNDGILEATREYFEKHLRCNFDVIKVLPNIHIEEGRNDNGTIAVTFKNWFKYQIDSTSYERVKRWRKRQNDNGVRGEENKKRKDIKKTLSLTPKFPEDSDPVLLSNHMLDEIKKNNPMAKEPNIQKWASDFDLILRMDKRNPDEIAKIIEWAQNDKFWKANILSPKKLRDKYDTLWMQMNR